MDNSRTISHREALDTFGASLSTLHRYIRAFEEIYVPLPRGSTSSRIYTPALIDFLRASYETADPHRRSPCTAIRDYGHQNPHALLSIANSYVNALHTSLDRSPERNTLAAVHLLTTASSARTELEIATLAARIQALEETVETDSKNLEKCWARLQLFEHITQRVIVFQMEQGDSFKSAMGEIAEEAGTAWKEYLEEKNSPTTDDEVSSLA